MYVREPGGSLPWAPTGSVEEPDRQPGSSSDAAPPRRIPRNGIDDLTGLQLVVILLLLLLPLPPLLLPLPLPPSSSTTIGMSSNCAAATRAVVCSTLWLASTSGMATPSRNRRSLLKRRCACAAKSAFTCPGSLCSRSQPLSRWWRWWFTSAAADVPKARNSKPEEDACRFFS